MLASVCIAGVAFAELTGVLAHHHIEGFLSVELYDNWKFVTITIFAIVTTLFNTSYLATLISERLHEREKQLAEKNVIPSIGKQ